VCERERESEQARECVRNRDILQIELISRAAGCAQRDRASERQSDRKREREKKRDRQRERGRERERKRERAKE